METWRYIVKTKYSAEKKLKPSEIREGVSKNFKMVLGDYFDLEVLREKNRVKLEINSPNKKSPGKVNIYSNLNIVETAVIAAALEDIGSIASTPINIEIQKIEDTKSRLREKVKERAQEILTSEMGFSPSPEKIKERVRQAEEKGDET